MLLQVAKLRQGLQADGEEPSVVVVGGNLLHPSTGEEQAAVLKVVDVRLIKVGRDVAFRGKHSDNSVHLKLLCMFCFRFLAVDQR